MNKPTEVEWIGGLTLLPVKPTPTSPQHQPEVLLWLSADGNVVGQALEPPGRLLARAAEHLRQTIANPVDGPTPAPTRVRVASTELADALRASHPALQIVVAPTPEFDALVTALARELSGLEAPDDEERASYFTVGLTPDALAAFFHAAAELWRASPWENLDTTNLQVSSKALGLNDCTLFLEHVPDESRGWMLFEPHEDFVDAFAPPRYGDSAPPLLVLDYLDGGDLSDSMRDEVEKHGWDVPSPRAFPSVSSIDEYGDPQPPTSQELQRAEAICLAVSELTATGSDHLSLTVKTHAGEVDVTLRLPDDLSDDDEPRGPADPDASHLLAKLFQLDRQDERDSTQLAALNEELLRLFLLSPEAKGIVRLEFVPRVLEDAEELFAMTIASVGATELTELVFTRKTTAYTATLTRVVAEVRAFYSFLKREFGLRQAEDCLIVVGDSAMMMMRSLSSGRGGGSSGRWQSSEAAAAKKKKKKRKEAKKARRKNRR